MGCRGAEAFRANGRASSSSGDHSVNRTVVQKMFMLGFHLLQSRTVSREAAVEQLAFTSAVTTSRGRRMRDPEVEARETWLVPHSSSRYPKPCVNIRGHDVGNLPPGLESTSLTPHRKP